MSPAAARAAGVAMRGAGRGAGVARVLSALAVMAAAGALTACSTNAPSGAVPESPAPANANQRAAAPAGLAVERQWLQAWFKDTPVVIAQRGDAAVTVDVPREFCFDPGRSAIKPALGAVLDKVAESLRRQPQLRLPLVAAPGDSAASAPSAPSAQLALQRAAQVQQRLLSRGVPAASLGKPSATPAAAVQLRIEPVPL